VCQGQYGALCGDLGLADQLLGGYPMNGKPAGRGRVPLVGWTRDGEAFVDGG
jgi:hypothetical protein